MPDVPVLHTNPWSRGRIARWMLEEVGVPYRVEIVAYGDAMKGAEYRAINPLGKVPALRHAGHVITETAAICAYLADAFPAAALAPPTDRRADYYRWLFVAAGPLEMAWTMKSFGIELSDEQHRRAGCGRLEDVLDMLEAALGSREFVAGERFTAADVYVGSQLGFGMQFGIVAHREAFDRYWQRLAARPAAIRANQLDDADAARLSATH